MSLTRTIGGFALGVGFGSLVAGVPALFILDRPDLWPHLGAMYLLAGAGLLGIADVQVDGPSGERARVVGAIIISVGIVLMWPLALFAATTTKNEP